MFSRRTWPIRRARVAAAALALALASAAFIAVPASAVPAPRGAFDDIDVHGDVVTVRGWAWSGTAGPTEVHFYDGAAGNAWVGKLSTSSSRPDVARAVPGAPTDTGFAGTFRVRDGAHRICAYAIGGSNPLIGCLAVSSKTPTTHEAIGSFDSIVRDKNGFRVRGWVWDPDTTGGLDSIRVTDETGAIIYSHGSIGNGETRRDVSRAFPGAYSSTGFDYSFTLDAIQGDRRICIETGSYGDPPGTRLGCRTVAAVGEPIGAYDVLTSYFPGNLTIKGWAFDWSGQKTAVHLYDNGRFMVSLDQMGSRADVSAAYPGSNGDNAWFLTLSNASKGTHTVCAYAINTPAGNNPSLGCKTVTVR